MTPIDPVHTNVLHLHIHPSLTDQLILCLLSILPQIIQSRAKVCFPEWFLPPSIIVKKAKPGWDDEFENEKTMYGRLQAFQGVLIPVYYGEAQYDGAPALLLSDIGGFPLCHPHAASMNEGDLLRTLHDAFGALATLSIIHDDANFDNYHLVGNKIMIVDLESAEESRGEP